MDCIGTFYIDVDVHVDAMSMQLYNQIDFLRVKLASKKGNVSLVRNIIWVEVKVPQTSCTQTQQCFGTHPCSSLLHSI